MERLYLDWLTHFSTRVMDCAVECVVRTMERLRPTDDLAIGDVSVCLCFELTDWYSTRAAVRVGTAVGPTRTSVVRHLHSLKIR